LPICVTLPFFQRMVVDAPASAAPALSSSAATGGDQGKPHHDAGR